jgi:hypothetical protein
VLWRWRGRGRWGSVGLLIGASVWLRPDGIPCWARQVCAAARSEAAGAAGCRPGLAGGRWLLLFAPYLLFNLLVQGSIWPNTFYAKQAEYACCAAAPAAAALLDQLKLPLIGAGCSCCLGFARICLAGLRGGVGGLAAVIWFLGYGAALCAAPAGGLPVRALFYAGHAGLFLHPGLAGHVVCCFAPLRAGAGPGCLRAHGCSAWPLDLAGVFATGANRYAQDVAIIETEMVAAARWVAANTPPMRSSPRMISARWAILASAACWTWPG